MLAFVPAEPRWSRRRPPLGLTPGNRRGVGRSRRRAPVRPRPAVTHSRRHGRSRARRTASTARRRRTRCVARRACGLPVVVVAGVVAAPPDRRAGSPARVASHPASAPIVGRQVAWAGSRSRFTARLAWLERTRRLPPTVAVENRHHGTAAWRAEDVLPRLVEVPSSLADPSALHEICRQRDHCNRGLW